MQSLAQIRELLDSAGLRPNKSLGQNFLVDHNLLAKLVDRAEVGDGDTVLEIGPGTGTLTEELLARDCRVIACELDRGLAALLRDRFRAQAEQGVFALVEGDCLAGKRAVNPELLAAVRDRSFALVANLPYGAGTPLMLALMADHPSCGSMAVTVQQEVSDRLCARPGSKDYGVLAIVAALSGTPERIATLPPACFWPRPKVTSAMAMWTRRADGPSPQTLRGAAECARVLFTQRRKTLGAAWKSLKVSCDLPRLEGADSTTRVESLPPQAFIALSDAVPLR
ncbi:MAG: 16S rRNA (adenine(1518)-N(6)/adenine(1519)-N(6))-dimethyltransferase RsmA [Planctomycetota bacterium]